MKNEKKWARISSCLAITQELQAQQNEVIQELIKFLMDEEKTHDHGNDVDEAGQKV